MGQEVSLTTSAYGDAIVLNASSPIATLDYGTEVAGTPVFAVSSLDAPVQIEFKYSEGYQYLDLPLADGPYPFSVSLANAFRVETFNITATGSFASPLVQGGQRWQSIRLLSGGSVVFDRVGFEATVDLYDARKLPAHFQSDDELLNKVWDLGATAAATGCVEKGSQPAIWEVDPAKGVLLRSTKPAAWAHGMDLANYTLEFDAMIEKGGVWWMMVRPSETLSSFASADTKLGLPKRRLWALPAVETRRRPPRGLNLRQREQNALPTEFHHGFV